MKTLLQNNREKVFADYFKTFESVDPADKKTHNIPNEAYDALLKRIAMTTISETSKDFTLIFNIEEVECTANASVGLTNLQPTPEAEGISSDVIHFDAVCTVGGAKRRFAVRLGIVDMELKMYTKLRTYAKQWEEHLDHYIEYFS